MRIKNIAIITFLVLNLSNLQAQVSVLTKQTQVKAILQTRMVHCPTYPMLIQDSSEKEFIYDTVSKLKIKFILY